MLHHVRDTGLGLDNPNVRSYQTNRAIPWHCDGSDFFMLLCVRASDDGGRNQLVSSAAVFNEIVRRRPELARLLQEPFHFDARGQQVVGCAPFQTVPIFNFHCGQLSALYKREYIELAQRFPEVPKMSAAVTEALDLLDAVCDELALGFVARAGDVLCCSNYAVLHARSAYADPGPEAEKRHMMRLWLSHPDGRPLPPAFAKTREFVHSFRRRAAEVGTCT
jgi:hypothetical protein